MKITVLQPNFFPFKSYFDLISKVDKVIFSDDTLYNSKTWVNKTILKRGKKRFIFKVNLDSEDENKLICDLNIDSKNWKRNFLKMLAKEYKNSKNFEKVFPILKEIVNLPVENMSQVSAYSIFRISQEFFNYKGEFLLSSKKYKNLQGSFRNRIIEICRKEGAKQFYTFSMYRSTFDSNFFVKNRVSISYFDSPNHEACSCIDFLMKDLDLIKKIV
tara:strand:+ start:51 stop:698 length:648 start_codon:yes stop_codon:yes gene_type:complete